MDDIRKRRRLEVLLSRLLLRAVLARILLQALELVLLLPIDVRKRIEELARLLAPTCPVLWRGPGYDRSACYLTRIVLRKRAQASPRYALFDCTRSFQGKVEVQGTARRRCSPGTTCRSQLYRECRAELLASGRIATECRCRPSASRGMLSQSL